jgi:uncharacterized protein (UPF0147 family)
MLSQHIKAEQLHACRCLNITIHLSVEDVANIQDEQIPEPIKQACKQQITRLKRGKAPTGVQSVRIYNVITNNQRISVYLSMKSVLTVIGSNIFAETVT